MPMNFDDMNELREIASVTGVISSLSLLSAGVAASIMILLDVSH